MSDFGKGLHRTPPDAVKGRVGAHLHPRIAAALAAGPKGSADLSWSLPGVFGQGATSTCWAHSAAACRFGALQLANRTVTHVPSPLYFAQCVYATYRNRETPPGRNLPPLVDTGAQLQDAAAVFSEWGDGPIGTLAPGRYSDVRDTSDDAGRPVPIPELAVGALARGSDESFAGEYSIPVDGDSPRMIMASLDAGILVWDGFDCDHACESLGPNDILGAPGTSLGGHSTLYHGYDLNLTRRYKVDGPVFFKRNSWGAAWANAGDFAVSTGHVVSSWSLWPFAVGS